METVDFLFERYKHNLIKHIVWEYKSRGTVITLEPVVETMSDIHIAKYPLSSREIYQLQNMFFTYLNEVLDNYSLDSLTVLYGI